MKNKIKGFFLLVLLVFSTFAALNLINIDKAKANSLVEGLAICNTTLHGDGSGGGWNSTGPSPFIDGTSWTTAIGCYTAVGNVGVDMACFAPHHSNGTLNSVTLGFGGWIHTGLSIQVYISYGYLIDGGLSQQLVGSLVGTTGTYNYSTFNIMFYCKDVNCFRNFVVSLHCGVLSGSVWYNVCWLNQCYIDIDYNYNPMADNPLKQFQTYVKPISLDYSDHLYWGLYGNPLYLNDTTKLDNAHAPVNYIACGINAGWEGKWTFGKLNSTLNGKPFIITNATLILVCKATVGTFNVRISNTTASNTWTVPITEYGIYQNYSINLLTFFSGSAPHNLNNTIMDFYCGYRGSQYNNEQIDAAYICFNSFPKPTLSTSLETLSGEGSWVFVDWRYYYFNETIPGVSIQAQIKSVYLQFNVRTRDGLINCTFYYNYSASSWNYVTNSTQARDLDPVRIGTGINRTSIDGNQTFCFPIWFTPRCEDAYNSTKISVNIWWSDVTNITSSIANYPSLFSIYSHGGFTLHRTVTAGAGNEPGGGVWDYYTTNSSYIVSDVVYRDLQHFKVLLSVNGTCIDRYWQQTFQMGYWTKNGYSPGLSAVINEQAMYGTSNIRTLAFYVYWYNNNNLIKRDTLFCFFHTGAEVPSVGDAFHAEIYVDLWFDSSNGSSLVGGRVNAYEYPMVNNAPSYLQWLSNSWGVWDVASYRSQCYAPLIVSGQRITVDQIIMVDARGGFGAINIPPGVIFNCTDISFDRTQSTTLPLSAISSPPWDQTGVATMSNAGLFGSIFSMFAGIGKWLGDNILFGGLSLWPMFVAFLDTIAGGLGFSHGFSNMITWLSSAWTWMLDSVGYVLNIFNAIFTFCISILGSIVSVFVQAITSFVTLIGMIQGFMGGAYGSGVNLWSQLGILQWLTLAIIFYPLWLIMEWEENGNDWLFNHLHQVWGIFAAIGHYFIVIMTFFLDLAGRIIESIPVVE
jgi:hypothetical protein